MSLYDYELSRQIAVRDEPFYALIMAAIRKADTGNLARLDAAFPDAVSEFRRRYDAPLGVIPEDGVTPEEYLEKLTGNPPV